MFTSKSYNKKDSRLLMALLLGLLLALSGCGGSSSSDIGGGDNGGAGPAGDQSLMGVAQKGPFQVGSEARIWPLMNGEKQGAPIKVTLGERGDFQFDQLDINGPALVEAEGRFFDEIRGNYSAQALTLRAVLDLSEQSSSANVNIFTHLIHERLLNELANGKDYQTALADTLLEYERLTGGLIMPPHELDVLMTEAGNDDESVNPLVFFDSAQLLLFSAAAVDLTQQQLEALSSGFAANGSADENTQAVWAAIGHGMQQVESQAKGGRSAAAVLQQRLLDQYPLSDGLQGYDIDELLNMAASPAATHGLVSNCSPGPMVGDENKFVHELCFGRELELNLRKGMTYVYFKFPAPGSYRLKMEREAGSTGKIEYSSRYSKNSSTAQEYCESWPSATTATFCSVSTPTFGHGSSSYLHIWANNEQPVKITATRISEGTSSEPVFLPLERRAHNTWAGSRYSNPEYYRGGMDSSNNLNHYLFWLSPSSKAKRLIIDRFGSSCAGSYGPMHFHLTNVSTNQVIVGRQFPDDDCNLSHQFGAGESGLYYLRVRQGRGLIDPVRVRDTSATHSFRIRLE